MQDEKRRITSRLEAASWGTFFVWVGVCFLAGLSWGVGLLGVATIILATQMFRASFKVGVEGFWVVAGVLFAGAGVWHLFDVAVDFGPLVLVAVGAAILFGAAFGKKHRPQH